MSTTKHGMVNTKTYQTWEAMKARCDNPNAENYCRYGALGVTYDPAWSDFKAFFRDMGERPEGKTLDRVKSELPYSKENCRWATPTEQVLNRRTPKHNTTGRKGVHWHKAAKKWFARGTINRKLEELYYGDSFEDAVKAREAWEVKNNVRPT